MRLFRNGVIVKQEVEHDTTTAFVVPAGCYSCKKNRCDCVLNDLII